MSNTISSTSATHTTQAATQTSTHTSSPMSKEATPVEPGAAADFFARDEVIKADHDDRASFFQDATPKTPARQQTNAQKPLSLHELQRQEQAQPPTAPDHGTQQLKALTSALGRTSSFDTETLKNPTMLGAQLNASFFDTRGDDKHLALGIRDMFNNEAKTRAALTASLNHLPALQRAEAVDHIMTKLSDKLCGMIQDDMKREVMFCTDVATKQLAPFCAADSTKRIELMHGLVNSSLSMKEMQGRLQQVGIPPNEARAITQDLLAVRKRGPGDAIHHALNAAKQDPAGAMKNWPQWKEGVIKDGALQHIDQAMKSAFTTAREGIDIVQEQVKNDRVQSDKMFTNPLFEQAFSHACERHGIDPDKEGAGSMVNTRLEAQKTSDQYEGYVCASVLVIASLSVPGGVAVALGTGAASSAPGVMIAQQNLNAAKGGHAAGTSDGKLVHTQQTARDVEVGAAIIGLVLGGVGNMDKGLVGTSAMEDAVSSIPLNDVDKFASLSQRLEKLDPDVANEFMKGQAFKEQLTHGTSTMVQELVPEFESALMQTLVADELKTPGE